MKGLEGRVGYMQRLKMPIDYLWQNFQPMHY